MQPMEEESKELNQIAKRPIDSTLSISQAKKDFNFAPTTLHNALNKLLELMIYQSP